MILQFKHVICA